MFQFATNTSKSDFWQVIYVAQQLKKNLGDTAFHTLIFFIISEWRDKGVTLATNLSFFFLFSFS